jgi:hypothetical protein
MATMIEVLYFLRPQGGYVANGLEYEGIQFLECEPFSKDEYEAAFPAFDSWKAEQDAAAAADKASATAKLEALGLTADDLKALGLGNN